MRFAVETWNPEYGVPADDGALAPSDAQTDVNVERPASEWAPVSTVAREARDRILFVDGVRRVDASIWIASGPISQQGLCATYAAGAVACDGRAVLVAAEIERGLFTRAGDAESVRTRHATYEVRAVARNAPEELVLALQRRMADLEFKVTVDAPEVDLVVVDGPLGLRRHLPNAIGFVKTHKVSYLPDSLVGTVAELAAGERTPLFVMCTHDVSRYSWYLRLPGPRDHAWASVVRCEISGDLDLDTAVEIAGRISAQLPRFASAEHKDPRAPQNLYPIAGLERELRRRLGDRELLYRSLRATARRDAAVQTRPVGP